MINKETKLQAPNIFIYKFQFESWFECTPNASSSFYYLFNCVVNVARNFNSENKITNK